MSIYVPELGEYISEDEVEVWEEIKKEVAEARMRERKRRFVEKYRDKLPREVVERYIGAGEEQKKPRRGRRKEG